MLVEKKQIEKVHKLSFLIKENSKLIDQLLKNLIDSSEKQLLVISDNKLVYSNQKTTKILGYAQKELKDKKVDDLFTSNQPIQIKNYISMAVSLRKKVQDPIMLKVLSKNGTEKWFIPEFRRCFWRGKSSVLLVLNDYPPKSNRGEKNLSEQSRIHLAFKVAHQGIWDYSFKTGESFISPEFFEMLGYKPETVNLTHETWLELLHPESYANYKKLEKDVQEGSAFSNTWEYRIRTAGGNYIWLMAIGQIVEWDRNGSPIRMVAIHIDIDEKKRIDVEKDETQSTLKGFIENSLDGLVIIDEAGFVREWNPVQEQITQIKSDIAIGKSILEIPRVELPDQNPKLSYLAQLKNIFSTISHTAKNPWESKVLESKIVLKDGSQKLIQQSIFTIKTRTGNKIALSVKDITESKTAQVKVEKSEERLKLALSAGNLGIWDVDFVAVENYFSPMAFTIFGYLPWEVEPTDRLWKSMVHPEDLDFVTQKIMNLLISGSSNELEFRARKKDGSYIWILSKNRIIKDEYGKTIRATGTISDISRQKAIENELRQNKDELIKNLAQHEITADISMIFNTNKPFNQKIEEVIKLLGHFTSVSRVYIFENKPSMDTTVNTYEWCNQNIEPQIENLQDVPLEMILKWSKGKEYLKSSNLKTDLPDEFANMMIEQGIKSFLIFPLQVCGKLFGYIGFDECSFERNWEKSEIELLKSISNLISFSFERELILEHFRLNENRYRELTEKLPQIIFEVSVKGRIEFLNQTGCTFFGLTKEKISLGVNVCDLFKSEDAAQLNVIRNLSVESKDLEPVRLMALAAKKEVKPIVVYARPRMENSEVVSFSGVALQILDVD